MQAEIITIGDEILSGKTVDTNSTFIAGQLMLIGVEPKYMSTISDDKAAIINTLEMALSRTSLVIITGGLGPTHDDITKHTLAQYFDRKLVRDDQLLDRLKAYFDSRGRVLDPLNYTQADFPENTLKLFNDRGTATGMGFERDGKWVFSMPGVPSEMMHMMSDQVLSLIKNNYSLDAYKIKDIQTIGISEAKLATALNDLNLDKMDQLKFAYLPKLGRVTLRIYYKSNFDNKTLEAVIDQIKLRVGDYIYSTQGNDIAQVIGNIMSENNLKLSLAESCTGGYLGHLITSVSGSSMYFEGGVIAYSNKVKEQHLGVNKATISEFGAVSQEVAKEMANGVRDKFNTDIGIAISGVAGPQGGTKDKPVGTICFALSSKHKTISRRYQFYKVRHMNIELSAITALRLLWEEFLKDF